MAEGHERIGEEHAGAYGGHDGADLFAHGGFVAMDRAAGAGRLAFMEGASVEALGGVFREPPAAGAEISLAAVVFPAMVPDHGGHGVLFPVYASMGHCSGCPARRRGGRASLGEPREDARRKARCKGILVAFSGGRRIIAVPGRIDADGFIDFLICMETPPFSDFGLKDELLEGVAALGFERPSPIQALAIPAALAGRDLIGLSQTGSGKTAAFGLPILQCIDLADRRVQAIVICPTRELAVQVCGDIHRLGSEMDRLSSVPVYGGAPMDRQIRHLRRGAHVVVGTPGRLIDHLDRGYLDLSGVRMAVLDEADRMLDMGFRDEMERLLEALPKERQTLLFSATFNHAVERIAARFVRDPEKVEVKQKAKTVESVDQCYCEVRGRSKVEVVSRLLDMEDSGLTILFCNTKKTVDECTEALLGRGYAADRLHGDISQTMRERVLNRFRSGAVEVLVATDVAARGLDIEGVEVVFNYDLPADPEDYLHRIGRTGRAGRSGRAVSFVFGREVRRLSMIERFTGQKIRRMKVPTQEEVEGKRTDRLFEAVKEQLESGGFEQYGVYVDRLLEQGHTPTDMVGALFSLLREATTREAEDIREDSEPDRPQREWRERRERPGRDPRGDRRDSRPPLPAPEKGYKRLFIGAGKIDGMKPGGIAGMLYRLADVPDGSIGKISLFGKHALVDVVDDMVGQVLDATRDVKIRGRRVRIDLDRAPR
jgi:ATP-dependent RNA helicase DeaD